MVKRIQCPHCKKHLAGEGHLDRHIRTIHKKEKY
jgi:hypothetical protein